MQPSKHSSNPYTAPGGRPDSSRHKETNSSTGWLGRAHLIIFGVLLIGFTILTWSCVNRGLDGGPHHQTAIIRTTVLAVLGPLTGAIARGATSGCCFEASIKLLMMALPIVLSSFVVQWCWRPRNIFLRCIRLGIWFAGWLVWFFSGIMSLGHALG